MRIMRLTALLPVTAALLLSACGDQQEDLRNWMAESAIRRARDGDFGEVEAVLQCLRKPFDDQPLNARYAAPPPDWAERLSVSCSS